MKPKELRDLSVAELAAKEKEFRDEEFHVRCNHATGQLEKTHRLGHLRRTIARIKTIIREKEGASQ
jgi:large subunit ribosomal protein L29